MTNLIKFLVILLFVIYITLTAWSSLVRGNDPNIITLRNIPGDTTALALPPLGILVEESSQQPDLSSYLSDWQYFDDNGWIRYYRHQFRF